MGSRRPAQSAPTGAIILGVAIVVAGALVALSLRGRDDAGTTPEREPVESAGPLEVTSERAPYVTPSLGRDPRVDHEDDDELAGDPLPRMPEPFGHLKDGDSLDARLLFGRWVERHREAVMARGEWVGVRDRLPSRVLVEESRDKYLGYAAAAMQAMLRFFEEVGRKPPPPKPKK